MKLTAVPLLLALLPRAAAAQSADERARLESLRAALAAEADSTALLARERAGMDRARQDRDNAFLHLELGFMAYRLGEVTGGRRHYDDAAGEFEWATELEPDWPYAWYGLGISELALGEHGVIAVENLRQALGRDFLSKAAAAFARAAEADPAFVSAVIDLAETARRQRIHPRLQVAQRALRAAAATPGAPPALHLARGRVERDLGEGDSALAAFQAFLAGGGDVGLGRLEQARTLFFLRRPDSARAAYYEGASAGISDSARAAYRQDLTWIATPEELAGFDAAPADGLREWLGAFWVSRDAAEGRAAGERVAEHYRRLVYAFRQFRLVSRHRQYTMEPYRSAQEQLDDRGVIYVRHGEPDDRAAFVAPDVDPNESWLYLRTEGNRVFHFVARGDVADYKLVESLADVLGFEQSIAWQAAGRLPATAAALYESRGHLDPMYRRIAGSTVSQGTALSSERRANRETIRIGTTTDSHVLRFRHDLGSRMQAYAVGGRRGGASLLLVFAVPGNRLAPQQVEAGMMYPLQLRLAHREAGEPPAFLDTTRLFLTSQPLAAGQHLTGYLEVPVEPGTHALRAVLMDPDGGGGDVVDIDSVVVPAFDAEGLTISDLVLGDEGAGLSWPVAGDTVPLSPLGTYAPGSSLELYYEIHGVDPGTRYRARVEVRGRQSGSVFARIGRLFGGGGPRVAFTFDGVTTARPTRGRQTVNLAPLDPGDYTLTLTVEDPARDIRHRRAVRFRVTGR
ncbi:MAG TPA: GWxTD domain-containing protein [Gemmatimonadales bacterium]|nr:GWxTD domain-containing protein [Gemmatimonadales bacterium]